MATSELVLVHGIYMAAWQLDWLRRALAARRRRAECFGYPSVLGDPDRTVRALAARWCATEPKPTLVAHSLGGLIALAALREHLGDRPARLLCLGTPLQGSQVARRLQQHPLLARLLGSSSKALCEGYSGRVAEHHTIAMIAGDLALGVGRLLGGLSGPSDGTVAVAETRSALLSGHRVVACSHAGLLFSPTVVDHIVHFLDHDRLAE